MPVGIEIDSAGLEEKLRTSRARIEAALEFGLRESGKALEKKVQEAVRTKMKVRTGRLLGSIGYRMPSKTVLEIGVVTPVDGKVLAYAGVQEFGGTIKGKPWLAIPIQSRTKTNPVLAGGGTKGTSGAGGINARDVKRNPGQFGFEGTFVRRRAKGTPIVFGKKPSGELVALYALRRSVTIKPKGYLIPTVKENLPVVQKFLQKQASDAMAAA